MPSTPRITARDRGVKPGTPVKQNLEMPGDWRGVQDANNDGQRGLLVPNGSGWVEHDTLGIAEEVARRWPNLRVAECQQRCRDCVALGHYPYVVTELTRTGKTVAVLGFIRLNREIIDTLWAMSQGDAQKLADEHNARVRAEIERKRHEKRQARLEIIGAALQSNKYDWRGPGGVRIGPNMSPADARRVLEQD